MRNLGEYSSHFKAAINREANALQGLVATGVRRIARRRPKKIDEDISEDLMPTEMEVPSISVVIGEGGSAGALALGVADRVLMMENAIYSTISPEDAAELIYQDEARADEAAESLKLTAQDCLSLGIVDIVVPEPPGGSHLSPDEAARQHDASHNPYRHPWPIPQPGSGASRAW